MRLIKNRTRLAVLLLALALLLTGCGAPADGGGDVSSTLPSGSGSESDTSLGAGSPVSTDSSSDGLDSVEQTPPLEGDSALPVRTGLVESEFVEISTEDANEVNRAVAGMWRGYVAGPNGEDSLVRSRDWDRYTSSLGQENLSRREAELFERLNDLCKKYLTTSAMDGVKVPCGGKNYTAAGNVQYSDLGLSRQQAGDVLFWFTYCYPQYYFLTGGGLTTSRDVLPCMYDFTADGEERAEITNTLFDKLDGWIQETAERSSNSYEKELYANNLICEAVTYNYDALKEGHDDEMSVCQSLYSSVMLDSTVCAGYSKTFCAMMGALDVDATAGISTGHAWNVVRCADGNCYCVDVCWNDTDRTPPYNNNYLNVGDAASKARDDSRESHTYDPSLAAWIPAIAAENYDHSQEESQRCDAPTNVKTTCTGETTAVTTWDPVPGAEVYDVCAYADSTCTKIMGDNTYTNPVDKGESFSWTGAKAGRTYYFGVRAGKNVNGETVYSDWVNISYIHQPAEEKAIAAPTNVKTTYTGEKTAVTTWDPVPGAEVYDVCAYADSTCTKIMGDNTYTNPADRGESFSWSGAKAGSTYYFGVRAGKDVDGETVYSDWVNISYVHQPAAPGGDGSAQEDTITAPTNVKTTSTGEKTAVTTWDPVPGAEVYDVCAYADSTCTKIMGENSYTNPVDKGESFSWTGAKAGSTYYFGVRAGKEINGEMVYSDWVNISYTHQ